MSNDVAASALFAVPKWLCYAQFVFEVVVKEPEAFSAMVQEVVSG